MSRDAQTDAMRAEMATQMDPEKISQEAQAVAEMQVKGTQTESRIEEMKIQRLVEHSNIENLFELGQHEDSLLQKKVDDTAAKKTKAMQSTVHENMLKLLNEEPAEEIGYDTQSEERDQIQHRSKTTTQVVVMQKN